MRRTSWVSLSSVLHCYGYVPEVGRFIERLEKELQPIAVILFGPLANDKHQPYSDADFCVILRERPLSPYMGYDRVTTMDPSGAVRPVVYGAEQFRRMVRQANPLALEVIADGVFLAGDENFCSELERLAADLCQTLGGDTHTTHQRRRHYQSYDNFAIFRPPVTI